MTCSPSQFIEHYFAALAEHGIRAVILHGGEQLTEKWESDIDYSVSPADLARVAAIGAGVAEKFGWSATRPMTANLHSFYQVYFCRDHPKEFIQFDACSDFVNSRCFLATAVELQAGAEQRGVFLAAAPAAEFAYHLGKNLAKGRPMERVMARLRDLARIEPAGCEAAFHRLLGSGVGPLEIWSSRDGVEWDELAPKLRARRRFGPWLAVREMLRLLRRWIAPHGLQIVVLGSDGTGKSTLIAALTRELAPFFRAVDYIHSRPHVLDPKPPGGVVSEPHAQVPRPWPACVAKVLFYAFDHWLGRIARIRPGMVRNRLVIFDRDFHDIIVDPTRYRMRGVGLLARAVAWFLPRADLTFVLDAPPEVIHARKPELTIAELGRQRSVLRRLADGRPTWRLLDATQSPEAVAREVVGAVLAKISTQP